MVGGQVVVDGAWYRRSNGAAGGGWRAITGSELEKKEEDSVTEEEEEDSVTEEEGSVTEEEEEPAIEEG